MKPISSIALALILSLFISPLVVAQEINFTTEGRCREYNVTVLAENFEPGIYDVKVDVHSDGQRVGEIYDPIEGWQSTMYYVNGALQVEENNNHTEGNVTVEIMTDRQDNVTMFARIRQNERTWTSEKRTIMQECPEPVEPDPEKIILISVIALFLILLGITVYKKNLF